MSLRLQQITPAKETIKGLMDAAARYIADANIPAHHDNGTQTAGQAGACMSA
jgi:hypothetical protein